MKKLLSKRNWRFLVATIASFTVCLIVTYTYISDHSKLEYTKMEQLTMSKANKVSTVLTKLLYKTQILAAFVQQSNGVINNFENMASTIIDEPSIRNVLLAPDGKVEYVYPIEGNEQVIGLDFYSEKNGNKEAILAKKTGQLVLGGQKHW